MRAIIWGVAGQDGYYLKTLLEEKGVEVIGLGKADKPPYLDITMYADVSSAIKEYQPDYVFNFAANSTVRHEVWRENHETIATGGLNILEAVKNLSPKTKVFLSGSGLQFLNKGLPIDEKTPFDASSMYAASRIYTTYAARYYRRLGIKVYTGFFFNHDSPRRSERHINKKILETAKRIANGSQEKLSVGDDSVQKEFGYAGDLVKAVWTLVQQEEIMEAVLGTGKAYRIADWLDICFSRFGLDWKEHTVRAAGYVREYSILVSNPSLIFNLGWEPQTSIEDLADLMAE